MREIILEAVIIILIGIIILLAMRGPEQVPVVLTSIQTRTIFVEKDNCSSTAQPTSAVVLANETKPLPEDTAIPDDGDEPGEPLQPRAPSPIPAVTTTGLPVPEFPFLQEMLS